MSPEPRETSERILASLLADPRRAALLADDLEDWIAVQDVPPDQRVAHLAAKSVTVALDAIDSGTPPVPPRHWVAALANAPVAVRVVVALGRLAGHDPAQTARLSFRTVQQVERLDAMVGPWRPPALAPVPATPPAPASDEGPLAHGGAPTPLPAADPAPTDVPRPHDGPPPVPTWASPDTPPPSPTAERPDQSEILSSIPPVTPIETPQKPRARRRYRRTVASVAGLAVIGGAVATAIVLSDPPARPRLQGTVDATVGPSTEVSKPALSGGCATPDRPAEILGDSIPVDIAGSARTFRLYAPAQADPTAARGLVVVVPDLNQPVDLVTAEAGLESIAAELDLAIVSLVSSSVPAQWNVLGAPDGPADLAYASVAVDETERRLCIDPDRVAVVGKGAGGHLAATLACAEPDRFHLVAMVAAAFRPTSCGVLTDTTVAMITGSADDIYPNSGGLGPGFSTLIADVNTLGAGARYDPPPFDAAVSGWAQDLDCDPASGQAVFDGPPPAEELTGARLGSCRGRSQLISVVVTGAGHQWTASASQIIRERVAARSSADG